MKIKRWFRERVKDIYSHLLRWQVEEKHVEELSTAQQQLADAAVAVRDNAYVDESQFKVGAAIRVRGRPDIFVGCNVENVILFAGHAEHVALTGMIAQIGCKPRPVVTEIAITLSAQKGFHAFPCGLCRQLIFEFGTEETIIIGIRIEEDGSVCSVVEILTLGLLFPFPFGPKNRGR